MPALKRLGIKTLRDLLFHFPARYDDFSNLKPVGEIKPGEIVTVSGKIKKVQNYKTARRHLFITEVLLEDESGSIKANWFNQPFLARNFRPGSMVNLSGKAAYGLHGLYLQNPAYEKISISSRTVHTAGLVAVYPETKGITSRWLRFLVKSFFDLSRNIADPLPLEVRQRQGLGEIKQALRAIHFPKNLGEAEKARHRFGFEGLFLIQLHALLAKVRLKKYSAPVIPLDISLIKKFVGSLPFSLTDAQRRSIWEIVQDLAKPQPMNRLLEGDVGSGKTVVAAAASLLCVKAGFRVVFMAPTEILARQHYATLQKILKPFEVSVGIMTGSSKEAAQDAWVVVGTHALIQKGTSFDKLGLAVVDEQHRFGVEQRFSLVRNNQRGALPHFLSMSATPIPRTLALTIYGDLDLSVLDELPKSRKEIITKIIAPGKREEVYKFIKKEVQGGRQVFVVCPRIEIPDPAEEYEISEQKLILAETKAVKEEYRKLAEEIFPDLKISMLHGKMPARGGSLPKANAPREHALGGKPSKEQVMKDFREGKYDILVSTSVIEVGVDVPNATIMVIEGAERFGLAQLHQFRGRVGRGAEQSYCFLFTTEDGRVTKRLQAVVQAKNGFELAEKDLAIRGPGDIFGRRQWGVSSNVSTIVTNPKMVREIRKEAAEVIQNDPSLKKFPALKNSLTEVEKTLHLE